MFTPAPPGLVTPPRGEAGPGGAAPSDGMLSAPILTHLRVVGELKGSLRRGVQLGHAHRPHHGG